MSVVFRRGAEYSEAFAGSGEIAAVRLVTEILNAEPYSLILLDEPETSLHPGAQRAVLRFLLEQIKLHKHQVVLSTHSPEFLNGLPDNAIKVFEDNGSGLARVLPQSSPSAALIRLGKVPSQKVRVLVEDELAALIASHASKTLDPGDVARLEIRVSPGGGDHMLKYSGPLYMDAQQPVCLMLDGDKKRVQTFSDPATIAPADHEALSQRLKDELGVDPLFNIPGGAGTAEHKTAKVNSQLGYLAWLRKRVAFLPQKLPEQILLEHYEPGQGHADNTRDEVKEALVHLVTEGEDVGEYGAAEILTWAKLKIAKIPANNSDISAIRSQLKTWLENI